MHNQPTVDNEIPSRRVFQNELARYQRTGAMALTNLSSDAA